MRRGAIEISHHRRNGWALRAATAKHLIVIFGCSLFVGCAALLPHSSSPIASWEGKHTVDEAVDCVTRTLDYNFRSSRPLIPSITHRVKVIEQGRVYEIVPETVLETEPLYYARVRSDGPQKTIIELYIPPSKYEVPLRDALAKCA
jgi:hypothetical protein